MHVSLVDCLIDQGTELSHVLGYRIDRIALFSQVSVSYTHLDVYKRQDMDNVRFHPIER